LECLSAQKMVVVQSLIYSLSPILFNHYRLDLFSGRYCNLSKNNSSSKKKERHSNWHAPPLRQIR
jgi:hypothetical protein